MEPRNPDIRHEKNEGSSFALLAFAAIFPGFALYHTLVGLGFVSPFLGGYSTAIAVVLLPGLAIVYLRELARTKQYSALEGVFGFFVLYFVVTALVHLAR